MQELVNRWAEKPTIQQVLLILWFHRVGGGPGAAATSHEICQNKDDLFKTAVWFISLQKRLRNQTRSKKREKSMQGEKPPNRCNTNFKKSCQHCRLPREVHAGCHVFNSCRGLPRVRFMLVATCTVHSGCHVFSSCRLPRIQFIQVATCTVHAGCHPYYYTVVHAGCRVLLPNLFPPPSFSQAHPLLLHRKQVSFTWISSMESSVCNSSCSLFLSLISESVEELVYYFFPFTRQNCWESCSLPRECRGQDFLKSSYPLRLKL